MTLTVHGLLHIADTIERIGPVWAWWSFPIERQCGRLQRHITSKHHPFVNLDNYITLANQFKTAKLIYNISDKDLSLDGPAKKKPGFELHDECTCSPRMACKTDLMFLGFRRRNYPPCPRSSRLPQGWRIFECYQILPIHPLRLEGQEGSRPFLGTRPHHT